MVGAGLGRRRAPLPQLGGELPVHVGGRRRGDPVREGPTVCAADAVRAKEHDEIVAADAFSLEAADDLR